MNILHVISGLQKAAGTSTFCGEVCNQLAALGHDVTLAVCCPSAPGNYPLDARVRLVSVDSLLHASSLGDTFSLVHIHGLWSPVLHKVSCWAHAQGIPVVWSTHGMTAPWSLKHKWWKKCLVWLLYQKWDLKAAAAIHCTTELEVDWNKKLGFNHCFVASLGTSLPNYCSTPNTCTSTSKTLLFVGRIYPVKALDRLIEAFARIDESTRRNWTLRLVGPDQAGHMAELMSLCDHLGLTYSSPEQNGKVSAVGLDLRLRPLVEFVGPKFDQDLDNEYAKCDCLALVSHTENFGATVVDAMAHGKPVITSTKTPWKVVADNKCGWWVDNDVATLTATLREVCGAEGLRAPRADAPSGDLTVGGYLPEMGRRGRELVRERYTWSAVCDKVVREYALVRK